MSSTLLQFLARITPSRIARKRQRSSRQNHRRRPLLGESLEPRLALTVQVTQAGDWEWQAAPGGGMQDMNTGLVWSPNFSDLLGGSWQSWDYANNFANNLALDGFTDWRLATVAKFKRPSPTT